MDVSWNGLFHPSEGDKPTEKECDEQALAAQEVQKVFLSGTIWIACGLAFDPANGEGVSDGERKERCCNGLHRYGMCRQVYGYACVHLQTSSTSWFSR